MAHPDGPAAGVAACARPGRRRSPASRSTSMPGRTRRWRKALGGLRRHDRARPLPDGLLVAFYGDDFTGSTAAMEVLAFAGLPTVLFLDTPTAEQAGALRRLPRHRHRRRRPLAEPRLDGRATCRRSSKRWRRSAHRSRTTRSARPSIRRRMSARSGAPSTSRRRSSAGLASPRRGRRPASGRYQAFGNLFAAVDGVGYRLDRHPTMSRHPVTPMDEADLGSILAKQTDRADRPRRPRGHEARRGGCALARELSGEPRSSPSTSLDDETLAEAGRLIWEHRGERLFAIGSQGLPAGAGRALAGGRPARAPTAAFRAAAAERIACVSGSCSPVTAGQIALPSATASPRSRSTRRCAVDGSAWECELGQAVERALAALGEGRDPLVFTAEARTIPRVAALRQAVASSGAAAETVNDRIGAGLGSILDQVLQEAAADDGR